MGLKNGNPHQSYHYIPSELLDDLCSRFIINLPPEDRWDVVRVCFHVELAHWFYLDNYCEMYNLRPCGQKTFATHIFKHIPDLRRHLSNIDIVLEKWREYKRGIPTFGAILLDEDLSHVLLVQSYYAKISWSFPKGKINEDEKPWDCAAREVLEETGFDISKLIKKRVYIDATVNGKTIRLYIVTNVPRDTIFKPRTRNEIKSCEWFPIDYLPLNKSDMTPNIKMNISQTSFVMVIPFMKKIRRWVFERKAYILNKLKKSSFKQTMSYVELSTSKTEKGTSELQDFGKNYQEEILLTHELQIAYMKYLQCNQPTVKMQHMETEKQQLNLPYYKYQDGQLYQVQNSPVTPNNTHVWSTNTINYNLEKYYQEDLPTQQLKNALMIYEKPDFPYSEYQESRLYQEQCSPNTSYNMSIDTSENNHSRTEGKLATGKQQLISSDTDSPNSTSIAHSPNVVCKDVSLFNFIAPLMADFKFDENDILDNYLKSVFYDGK